MNDILKARAAQKLAIANEAVKTGGLDAGKGGLTGAMTNDYHAAMRQLTASIKPLAGLADVLALPWQGNYAGDRHLQKLVDQQLIMNTKLSADMRKQALLLSGICMIGEIGNEAVTDELLAEWCETRDYDETAWPWTDGAKERP
jgi:hypothetical protein